MSVQSEPVAKLASDEWFNLPKILFDQMRIGFVVFTKELTLYQCNLTWARLISQHTSNIKRIKPGLTLFDLNNEVKDNFLPLLKQALTGVVVTKEAFGLKGGNSTFYYNLAFAPIQNKLPANILGLIIDVTDQFLQSQALQSEVELEPFDLNTLIAVARTLVLLEDDRLYQQARHMAVLEERSRLARELHDNVAQALGYMNLQTAAADQLLSKGLINDAQAKLQELKQVVGDVYTDVREEIFNLRATASRGLGFLGTLRNYVEKYKRYYDLEIELAIEMEESQLEFPVDVATQIIRVIQEALINVRKHSGVNKALIRFRQENNRLRISVEDSGQGFDSEQIDKTGESGFGLQIMRERAVSAGGRLEVDTTPGEGVRVIIWMPMTSEV